MPWEILFSNVSSLDAVLIIAFFCILTLIVKSKKGNERAEILGIWMIGAISLLTLVARLILYFAENYIQAVTKG